MITPFTRLSASRLATRSLGSCTALTVTSCQHHRLISFSCRFQSTAGKDGPKTSPPLPNPGGSRRSSSTSTSTPIPNPPTTFTPPSNADLTSLSSHLKSHNFLAKNIHETCSLFGAAHRYGPGPNDTGMNRLALTDADRDVRDWFVAEAQGLGCEVAVDEMGNIWAVRDGFVSTSNEEVEDRQRDKQRGSRLHSLRSPGSLRSPLPPVMMGSHLDTQPRGGRYDGILGIMAGLEALRTLKETNTQTWRPVGVVCWTNEEGARFPVSMVSSGVWAGEIELERAHSLREVSGDGKGRTMREELERIGYLGKNKKCSWTEMPMAAHFELHIEQGPILESLKKRVGVVVGSQAYKWFTIEVEGKEAHTGTTPYPQRADALMAATSMIQHARYLSDKSGDDILVSVGVFQVFPGSVNTIPGRVRFSLDVRSPSTKKLEQFVKDLRPELESVAGNAEYSAIPCTITTWREDTNSPSQGFDGRCIEAVKASALSVLGEETGSPEKLVEENMISGAGHDSVYTARRCPTSMIFVPSRGGLSHHPEEYTSEEDCVRGAQVLLKSVLRFDRDVCWRGDMGLAVERGLGEEEE